MLSKNAIEEFKNIWRSEHNQKLSDKEALDRAISLLELFKAVYKPIPVRVYGKANQHQS